MTGGSMRVLIVDDEPSMLLTLAANLELEGFDVDTAATGDEALEKFAERPFDIVMSDIRMPGMNGVELFRRVRALAPSLPVVLMTGFAVEGLVQEAVQEGAFAVLPKPFDIPKAIRALTHAIRSSIVLLVDPPEAEAATSVLRAVGLRATHATAPAQAIDLVRSGEVDVCVVDLSLDGAPTAIEEIRRVDPAIVHIAVAGARAADALRRAAADGAFACLRKPVSPRQLVEVIARARAGRPAVSR
jgi:DNA-binding NtrC family response regulator